MTCKKVLIATDVMLRGGVDTYAIDLATSALKKRWDVEIVVDTQTASAIPQELISFCPIHFGPIYHRLHSKETIDHFYFELVKERAPDLVHIICGIPWGCLQIREATSKLNIPFLFTEQYVPSELFLENSILDRLKHVYNQAKTIIYVSKENQETLAKSLSIPSHSPCYLIPNGIDWRRIQKKSLSLLARNKQLKDRLKQGKKIRILSLGRWTRQKGVDLLIEAVGYLSAKQREKIQLDIWGEGSEYITLQKMVNDLNLHTVVQFYSWTNKGVDLFSTYDLFVFPSRFEGLPFTLLEAMASGIPMLVSDIPTHRWITQSGRYALLFESENPKSLLGTLINWLDHPFKSPVENDSSWLKKNFDKQTNIKQTLNIWERILNA